jgi:hypothetical protein
VNEMNFGGVIGSAPGGLFSVSRCVVDLVVWGAGVWCSGSFVCLLFRGV